MLEANMARIQALEQQVRQAEQQRDYRTAGDLRLRLGLEYTNIGLTTQAIENGRRIREIGREVESRELQQSGTLLTLDLLARHNKRQEAQSLIDEIADEVATANTEPNAESTKQGDDSPGATVVAYGKGALHLSRGEYELARQEFETARTRAAKVLDVTAQAAAVHNLGVTALRMGNYLLARRELIEAAKLFEQLGDERAMTTATQDLATVLVHQGDYETAERMFQEALAEYQRQPVNLVGEAAVRHNLGACYSYMSRFGSARDQFEESLRIKWELDDVDGEESTLYNLACLELAAGDDQTAGALFQTVLEGKQKREDPAGEAAAWRGLGAVDLHQGHYDIARDNLNVALGLEEQLGNRTQIAAIHQGLGMADLHLGDYTAARAHFDEYARLSQLVVESPGQQQPEGVQPPRPLAPVDPMPKPSPGRSLRDEVNINYRRGRTFSQLQDYSKAIENYTRAIEGNPNFDLAYLDRAQAYYASGNKQAAIVDLQRVSTSSQDAEMRARALESMRRFQA